MKGIGWEGIGRVFEGCSKEGYLTGRWVGE